MEKSEKEKWLKGKEWWKRNFIRNGPTRNQLSRKQFEALVKVVEPLSF